MASVLGRRREQSNRRRNGMDEHLTHIGEKVTGVLKLVLI
jgi:hypothetical protein